MLRENTGTILSGICPCAVLTLVSTEMGFVVGSCEELMGKKMRQTFKYWPLSCIQLVEATSIRVHDFQNLFSFSVLCCILNYTTFPIYLNLFTLYSFIFLICLPRDRTWNTAINITHMFAILRECIAYLEKKTLNMSVP